MQNLMLSLFVAILTSLFWLYSSIEPKEHQCKSERECEQYCLTQLPRHSVLIDENIGEYERTISENQKRFILEFGGYKDATR